MNDDMKPIVLIGLCPGKQKAENVMKFLKVLQRNLELYGPSQTSITGGRYDETMIREITENHVFSS